MTLMDISNLPGALKVAVLIHSMDKATAGRIMDAMNEKERKLVQSHMAQIGDSISPQLISKIADPLCIAAWRW